MAGSVDNCACTPIPAETEKLASVIIDAGMKVHKLIGPGLLESVYEQCLAYELTARGHVVYAGKCLSRSRMGGSFLSPRTGSTWSSTIALLLR